MLFCAVCFRNQPPEIWQLHCLFFIIVLPRFAVGDWDRQFNELRKDMYFLCHLYIICTICTAHCWPIQCCIYLSKEIFAQEVPFAQCLSCTFSSPSESSATQASPCWLLQLSPQQCSSERCLMKNTKKWKFMQIFLIYFGYILWPLLSPTPLRFTLLSLCLSLASENASVATLSRTTGRCVCRVVRRDWRSHPQLPITVACPWPQPLCSWSLSHSWPGQITQPQVTDAPLLGLTTTQLWVASPVGRLLLGAPALAWRHLYLQPPST